MRQLKPFHLLHPHREDCAMFNKWQDGQIPWCLPQSEYIDLRRDQSKPAGFLRKSWVLQYRCADSSCEAKLAVRMDYANEQLGLVKDAVRTLGKPKPTKTAAENSPAMREAQAV
jgi:hypothetical protein